MVPIGDVDRAASHGAREVGDDSHIGKRPDAVCHAQIVADLEDVLGHRLHGEKASEDNEREERENLSDHDARMRVKQRGDRFVDDDGSVFEGEIEELRQQVQVTLELGSGGRIEVARPEKGDAPREDLAEEVERLKDQFSLTPEQAEEQQDETINEVEITKRAEKLRREDRR